MGSANEPATGIAILTEVAKKLSVGLVANLKVEGREKGEKQTKDCSSGMTGETVAMIKRSSVK